MAASIEWYALASGYMYYPEGEVVSPTGSDTSSTAYRNLYARAVGATGVVTWSLSGGLLGGVLSVASGGPEELEGVITSVAAAHGYGPDPVTFVPSAANAVCVYNPSALDTFYLTAKEDGVDIPGELFVTFTADLVYPSLAWGGGGVPPTAPPFWSKFQNSYEVP